MGINPRKQARQGFFSIYPAIPDRRFFYIILDINMKEDLHNEIIKTIKSAISDYENINRLCNMWREPIIEIISAKNEKLRELKQIVSLEHFMPYDILPDSKSIISFFIPFSENIAKSNINGTMASKVHRDVTQPRPICARN